MLTKENRAELFSKAQQLVNASTFSHQVEAQFTRIMQLIEASDAASKTVTELRTEGEQTHELRALEELRHYIHGGQRRTYQALQTGATPGSIIVPNGQWLQQYQAHLKSASGWLRAKATIQNTTSGVPFLTFMADDTANEATILDGENEVLPQVNPIFAVPTPVLKNFATSVTVSNQLRQDSQIGDLDSFLQGSFGLRIGRKLNDFATNDATYGLLAQLTVGSTAASSSLPTLAELSDMQSSAQLDPAYLEPTSEPVYMMAPALISLLRKQTTTDGLRIYPEIEAGRLLSLPLIPNVSMGADAGDVAVVCGSVKRAVLVQSVFPTFTRSVERYIESNQTLYGMVNRIGVKLLDGDAVTALKLHA